ncbi:MAG TPA: methyltransferase [Hyphomicrobiaceae bacterium]|nr:methyltransferase [Hyphomicrobiaceae bacterium]
MPQPDTIPPDASDDRFLGGRIVLRQPRRGYRAGLDAVLLAAGGAMVDAAGDTGSRRILDLGAGVGGAGLCLASRVAEAHVTLVEREAQLAALARHNVSTNGFDDQVDVIEGDAESRWSALAAAGLQRESYDNVICNPPFYADASGTAPAAHLKAMAHQMATSGLQLWIRTLATAAAAGGTLTLIHRTEALADVLGAIGDRFGAIGVLPIAPRCGKDAIRILVRGVKGSRAPLRLASPLVLHDAEGRFCPEVDDILRNGAALVWP